MLLCSAAASDLFVVPALGISMHTVASLWRRGMLGLIAFVSVTHPQHIDELPC